MKRHSSFGKEVEFAARPSTDVELQVVYKEELEYPPWYCKERLFQYLHSAPEDPVWNGFICILVLAAIVWVVIEETHRYVEIADLMYNFIYGAHVLGIAYNTFVTTEHSEVDMWILWDLNGYNLNGSILGTSLKYIYIFAVLRISWACIWLQLDEYENNKGQQEFRALKFVQNYQELTRDTESVQSKFLSAIYIVNKMFIPIGPSVPPANDIERLICLMIMISGCLVVTGAAVASLSLVISIYMRPEEAFRARYRLIMKEMSETNVPPSLRQKVETFYKMYWHKQRAVSEAQLLKTFPPTLPTLIFTDIYFEATQRNRILCDLRFEFLCELAKKMTTINYIPGDVIIKRNTTKSSIIFITYGDVEMVTAEDDSTPILRMTRGTVLSPCAGGVVAACARSHVMIRAASFCTAHVLHVADLWRVALKYGKTNYQSEAILEAFYNHFDKVKTHYNTKFREEAKYKSSILSFKNNLRVLKQTTDAQGNLILDHPEIFLEIASSYIMRNRTDSSTDESDAICLKSTFPCILQPDSSMQVAWQIVVSLCTVVAAVVIPYYVVFVATWPIEFELFRNFIDVINIIDVIVHLSTGANVEEGVPINFMQTSSQQMRSIWFILDVAAILPIFFFIGDGQFNGINKLLKIPKVFRNLKSLEELCVYSSNKMRLISFTLLTLIACYLIATLQQGFMCFQFGHCLVKNYTHSPYWHKEPLDDDTVEARLTFGLYWAISIMTFTTHMEMFKLSKWDNVIYTVLLLEICIVMHIFIEAVYSATIMVTTFLRDDYDSTISNVKNFLIRNDVDPQMRKRFITYLELCWYTDKAYSMTNKKKSIFHDLPPHVYQEIVSRKRSKYILNIPFMKLLSRADLKTISSTARLFYTSPNEILMNTGDITNEMFVIKQGMCEVINPDTREVVAVLSAKGHFGVAECMLRTFRFRHMFNPQGLPVFYTVRAVTHVQLFSISKKNMGKLIDIPQIKYAIKYARSLPEYRNLQYRRDAFLYFEPPAPAPNREKFRLPKKYEQDTAFLQPFTRLGFLAVLKYVFPRFTIRPDGKYLQRYEWFRGACAMLTAMVCPCYTYLVLQWPGLYHFMTLLDMAAYFDIVQRLLIGYYNDMGILVYHPAATSAYYLKGPFIVDLLACVPLEFLETEMKVYRLNSIRQMLMMNRLLQMYRLPSAIKSLTGYIERRDIHLVIHAIPYFITLLNVLTCFVIFASTDIYYTQEGTNAWKIRPYRDSGGSFNMRGTPWNLHLATYFWVVYVTTTTGYGSFHPTNFILMKIFFIGMVIGTMVITYFSVCIISIRANVNKELAGFQEDLRDIINFMRKEELDKDLQKEVLDYYEYNWDKMGGVDYNKVLKLCGQMTLRTDAILHIYGSTFAKCPFLSKCDISLLRVLGREVKSIYLLRGMNIIEADDVISDLYFLVYGKVQVRIFYDDCSVMHKLSKGSVFGNLDQLTMVRSQSTIVTQTRVHVLQIKTYNFQRTLADFPEVQKLMVKCRGDNENFIPGSANLRGPRDRRSTIGMRERRSTYGNMFFKSRRGLIKHLYFKDKYIQIYLIVVSLACVYLDVYNAGFQNNSIQLIIVLYALDVAFLVKVLIQYSLPYIVDADNLKKMTVYKCLVRHHERLNINLTVTTVFTVVIWFSLFIHTSTCLWYFIGVMEDAKRPQSSWIYSRNNGTLCSNLYVCSMYFVLTTFTQNGVGDIMPKNHSEVVFVCIFQIISVMVYMVYVGEFSNIIQYQSFRNFGFYCKFLELKHFLANNRVSKNLVNTVNHYSLHLWREARGLQVPHFLETAPPALKLKVMAAAYMTHLNHHIVFEACERAFLRQLVGKLKMYYYNRNMFIVKEGEITDTIYIVHTGKVRETSSRSTTIRSIIAGGSFGLVEGLYPNTPFKCSYQSVLKSQILTLAYEDWNFLLTHFPNSADSIYDHLDFDDDSGQPYERPTFHQVRKTSIPWAHADFAPVPPGAGGPPGFPPSSPPGALSEDAAPEPSELNRQETELPRTLKKTSDSQSEFELTNISLTDRLDGEAMQELPRTGESLATIKNADSSDDTSPSGTSGMSESGPESEDLEAMKLSREESFRDSLFQDNKNKEEGLNKESPSDRETTVKDETKYNDNEDALSSFSIDKNLLDSEAQVTSTTLINVLKSRHTEHVPSELKLSQSAAILNPEPEISTTSDQADHSGASKDEKKLLQTLVDFDVEDYDGIDDSDHKDNAAIRLNRRSVHVRYKDEKSLLQGVPLQPEDAQDHEQPSTSSENKNKNVDKKKDSEKK
ncbi:uncharacterized protein LOC106136834 [Amyelois transitella]|uniref:uncharacterized protein LOC106136834 n=1 Tax=Amyelois transitella TaxID=680683 RepID=UPI00298FA615|nr:uncharacterized protein LOC106136834 [Amyelois transitella]